MRLVYSECCDNSVGGTSLLCGEEGRFCSFACRLEACTDCLVEDEMEVLCEVAEGLRLGQIKYGPLDLTTDPRDFDREADEEDRDWLVYRASSIILHRRSRALRAKGDY